MADSTKTEHCFNCGRDEAAIPVIAWRFQGRSLSVCSECMPLLIHKWQQIVTSLTLSDNSETTGQSG